MTFIKKTLASSIAIAATAAMATAAQAQISDGAVRIGYLADMSGTYRDLAGPGGLEALRMAVEDFGGSVNGAPIEVFSADDRNSADVGANTVREWVDQRNVDLVAGMVASSVTIAVTNVLQANDKLGIISGSAASSITNEHCSPNHIHWVYDTYPLANGTAKAVVEQGGDTWFMLTADYAFGHALEGDVERVVTENGGTIVGKIRHPFPTDDFSSYILQAQGLEPRSSAWPTPARTPSTPSTRLASSAWWRPGSSLPACWCSSTMFTPWALTPLRACC